MVPILLSDLFIKNRNSKEISNNKSLSISCLFYMVEMYQIAGQNFENMLSDIKRDLLKLFAVNI